MDAVQQKAARVLNEFAGKKLAVGVSGGRDSMCLLHAVLCCGIFDKSDVTVVHVNHCLRIEADDDERFVKEYCLNNGVKFYSRKVDVKLAAKNGISVEHAARELRYGVFRDILKSGEADIVLTAHHALDNAESVLMHMFRGAGLDGLCGMRSVSGQTVRPFLDVYPAELDDYAKRHNIEFVVDKTNFEDDADRNFIRLNVLPLIERRYTGAVRAINALSRECVNASAVLDGLLESDRVCVSDDAITVDDDALRSPFAARYVRRAAAHFSSVDLTRDMVERAVALVDKKTGASVDMNNGVKAIREYGRIALYVPRLTCTAEYPVRLGANFIDGLAVDIEISDADFKRVRGGAVDFSKLDGAVLRFRRDGDYFTSFGGKRKKLKQYFIDKKVEKRVRDRIPLICKGNEVLVVVGVEIADGVKIDRATTARAVVRLRGIGDDNTGDEIIEPLGGGNVIVQPKNGYRFGADAVALYKFANRYVKKDSTVFELCSGCGIVGISIAIEKGCKVRGAEIDGALCGMSNRAVALNGLDDVEFINTDIKELRADEKFDFAVCNPPFFKAESMPRRIAPTANSEILVTFADVAEAAKRILKPNGALILVHTSSRLDEILCYCREHGFMPKTLEFINNGKAFLLRAVRGGKSGLTVETGNE